LVFTLRIREIVPATPRAAILRIDVAGAPGGRFDYAAGQAVLVATDANLKRKPYSLAAAPEEARRDGWIELLVGLDERGQPGSHLVLERGATIHVEGPIGGFTFPDHPEERRFLFIAGGLGIAPLRAMLHRALRIPDGRIGLLYSARTSQEFAYDSELKALAAEGRIELRQTVTRESSSDWTGARGRLGRADLEPLVHDPVTLCFVCGPPPLVDELPKQLAALGVERTRIRIEEWG
jgi:ferredoxin-NADP reductase